MKTSSNIILGTFVTLLIFLAFLVMSGPNKEDLAQIKKGMPKEKALEILQMDEDDWSKMDEGSFKYAINYNKGLNKYTLWVTTKGNRVTNVYAR